VIKLNAYVWGDIINLLLVGASNREIAEETGLTPDTVREYTTVLHKKKKAVHIDSWDSDPRGAMTVAVYRLGPGKDAKKPKPRTATQRKQAQRARERALQMIHATAGATA
jgi:predicted transcriptional regulator